VRECNVFRKALCRAQTCASGDIVVCVCMCMYMGVGVGVGMDVGMCV